MANRYLIVRCKRRDKHFFINFKNETTKTNIMLSFFHNKTIQSEINKANKDRMTTVIA